MWTESQAGAASQVTLSKLFLHTSITCSLKNRMWFSCLRDFIKINEFVKHSAELGQGAGTAHEPLAGGRTQVPVSTWERGVCIFSTLSISWSTALSHCPDENTKLRAKLSFSLICLEVFEVTFALWGERWRPGGCLISPGERQCWS